MAGQFSESRLTAAQRKHLPASSFALSGRRFPIPDKAHARAALSRAAHKGGGVESKVRAAVHRKFPSIGEDIRVEADKLISEDAGEEKREVAIGKEILD